MLRHVGDDRSTEPDGSVVPTLLSARRVLLCVPALALVVRQVDAADERDAIVDDDELLVMAVHRPFLRVGGKPYSRAELERMPHAVDVLAVRMEEGQRRAGPDEHVDVDALGELCEQRLELRAVGELEPRRQVPAGEMDM